MDTLIINDYHSTLGCFVPPTPSKLGLYPKYQPRIYQDYTYSTPVNVIQGHDGSITVAYNDFRDAIILEFEKLIKERKINITAHCKGFFEKTEF